MEDKIKEMYLSAETVDDLIKLGQFIYDAGLAPYEYKKNPQALTTIIMHGFTLGLNWSTSVTQLGIIDGNIVCKGDTLLRLVRESGQLEKFEVNYEGDREDLSCVITIQRKGEEVGYFEYSVAEAKASEIIDEYWWKRYPQRMTYYKALGFALRTIFSDITQGMYVYEEMDMDKVEKKDPTVKDAEIAENTLKHLQ